MDLGLLRTFGYDLVDRLKTVHTNGTQTEFYNFDDVGNRSSSHLSSTYSYQAGKFNQLASTATATMQFDANGNTVQKSEGSNLWRYTWDYENRLTRASTRKQNVPYRYDALGRRVERNLDYGKERTKFSHDGLDVLVDDEAGTLTKYINGSGIDKKLRLQTGSDVKYFLADHLGSTNGLADSTGLVVSQTAYDSFGNQTATIQTRYGFTARERDDFTGQMHYRARFYNPNLGRFTSEDPIGFGGGDVNLYGYVRNQPLWFRDPMGLRPGADVMNAETLRAAGSAAAAVGSTAAAAGLLVPAAVVAGGALAIYVSWQVGETIARHPSNPLSRPWVSPDVIRPPYPPITMSPTSQPYCKPISKAIPFPEAIPFPRVIPVPTPERRNCAEEIKGCTRMCADRQGDPDFKKGFGGSLQQCIKNCLSEECGGEPKWKGFKSKPGPRIWKF